MDEVNMADVLAVVDDGGDEDEAAAVTGVARAVAEILRTGIREIHLVPGSGARETATTVLRELERASTLLGVLADGAPPGVMSWWVVRRCTKPVVLLPPSPVPVMPPATPVARGTPLTPHHVISRVLLPLDGSFEAAAAVIETARLFTRTGVDLVVLHVFDEVTVPRFWDQAAHARQAWEQEFLARHCACPGVRLELRSGVAGEQVVSVAAAEHVDLIALGWSQHLDEGRARTVRETLADARVPVMLIPVARHEETSSGESGPRERPVR
ncbi:universal stress protein [Streptosporangium sp. NPDC000509]|uniref:universal stress protein n=1 Tax=Streptosporangium sp. NPDC000509 TaxID=3366186 RepID=UPI0036CF3CA3